MRETLEPDRIYVAVDILVLAVQEGTLRLLLSQRTAPPYAGRWALPGRIVGLEESAETAVRRLLGEMLPIPDAYMEQLYTFTDVNRDPRGRVISTAYLVIAPCRPLRERLAGKNNRLRPFDIALERSELRLTDANGGALVGGDLAFDHGRIVRTGLARLRGKIDYTDIAFRFLNDAQAFSLSELQTVFEAVLARPVDGSNFRRAIMNRYLSTGRIAPQDRAEKRGRGRPAALYRWIG